MDRWLAMQRLSLTMSSNTPQQQSTDNIPPYCVIELVSRQRLRAHGGGFSCVQRQSIQHQKNVVDGGMEF